MGLYPVNPATGIYVIGSPDLEMSEITLPAGNSFRIEAGELTDENIYIQSATLNGLPLERSYITHDEIMSGGVLHFKMGPEPNMNWAANADGRPVNSIQ